jgi:hypothetical protein
MRYEMIFNFGIEVGREDSAGFKLALRGVGSSVDDSLRINLCDPWNFYELRNGRVIYVQLGNGRRADVRGRLIVDALCEGSGRRDAAEEASYGEKESAQRE